MDCSPNTTRRGILSGAIAAEFVAESAKGSSSVEDLIEAMGIFRRLSPEGQKAAIAVARWLVEDGRPETDPRINDPYWLTFQAQQQAAAA